MANHSLEAGWPPPLQSCHNTGRHCCRVWRTPQRTALKQMRRRPQVPERTGGWRVQRASGTLVGAHTCNRKSPQGAPAQRPEVAGKSPCSREIQHARSNSDWKVLCFHGFGTGAFHSHRAGLWREEPGGSPPQESYCGRKGHWVRNSKAGGDWKVPQGISVGLGWLLLSPRFRTTWAD